MRIPIPVAILLAVALVAGIWWQQTRKYDFLTPPGAARLEQIREKTAQSIARPPVIEDAISVHGTPNPDAIVKPAEPLPVEPPKPAIDPGNLSEVPASNAYADQAFKGSAYLVELASFLETEGHLLRAYLAWERVIDSSKPDEVQLKAATNALKRLRPSMAKWNEDPARKTTIIIQVGTGKKITKKLKPILDQAAKDLEAASSGLLTVKTNITLGKGQPYEQPEIPIAIWFSGAAKDAPATEVLSFTTSDKDDLTQLTTHTLYTLLRSYFSHSALTPPSQANEGEKFVDSLERRVTRLTWEQLGSTLNQKPAPTP